MIPKRWRIRFFNWLGAGKVALTQDKPKDYYMANTYTIGGGGNGYNGGITLGPATQGPITNQTLTLRITPANGGQIISIGDDLYIIGEGSDFDRELGKIITMNKLKT